MATQKQKPSAQQQKEQGQGSRQTQPNPVEIARNKKGSPPRPPEENYPDESAKRTDRHDRAGEESNPNRQGARQTDKDQGESCTG